MKTIFKFSQRKKLSSWSSECELEGLCILQNQGEIYLVQRFESCRAISICVFYVRAHVCTYMRTCIVLCQDVCRRACTVVSTKHGAPEQPGLDQVNNAGMTPPMAVCAAANHLMAFELAATSATPCQECI